VFVCFQIRKDDLRAKVNFHQALCMSFVIKWVLFFAHLCLFISPKTTKNFLQNGEQNPKSTAIADCCSYQQGVDI